MRDCDNCGNPAPTGRFCGRCGAPVTAPEEPATAQPSQGGTDIEATMVNPAWPSGSPASADSQSTGSHAGPPAAPDARVSSPATGGFSGPPGNASDRAPGLWTSETESVRPGQGYGPPGQGYSSGPGGPGGHYGDPGRAPLTGGSAAGPATGANEPVAGGAPNRRKLAIIGIAVLAVAIAATTTLILTNRSSPAAAFGGGNGSLPSLTGQPTVGGQVDLRDLFDHASPAANSTQVIALTPDTYVISSVGQLSNSTTSFEDVVASIDRATGKVKWKVADKDLDPRGNAAGAQGFACSLTQLAAYLVCGQEEQTASGDDPHIAMTRIKVADGTFTSTEPDGLFNYSIETVGEDALLTRSDTTGGNFQIVRVDSTTGKDKWTAPVTFMADDFSGASFQNGFVQVLETNGDNGSNGSSFSTDLLDPDTGKIVHQLDGALNNMGTDYYGTINTGSTSGTSSGGSTSQGSKRVSADGKVVWENPDASLMFGSYSAADPLLAMEGDNLVGLGPNDGKEVWTSDKKITGYATAISAGRGFVSESQIIRIINLANGDQVGTANGSWIGAGASVFYTTDGGRLYGWDAASGRNLWRADFHDLSPLLSSDTDTRIVASGGALFAEDARSIGILAGGS